MQAYPYTALILLLSVALQLWLMIRVGGWRRRSGIDAPAMTGDPNLERAIRAQMNTLEQLGLFLPALLVAAAYWSDVWAGLLGAAWLLGRVLYAIGYQRDPKQRGIGFTISFLATAALWLGALVYWLRSIL